MSGADRSDGIVLHDYWRSSACYRVRIALGLKGLSWRSVPLDLTTGAQRLPGHLSRNPQGLLPVLEIDGLTLTQSLGIIEYLDETRPAYPLLPRGPAARAFVRSLSLAIACETHPLSNPSVLARVEALAGAEAREIWNRDNIRRGLEAFEAMLAHGDSDAPFCCGANPGIADCVLVPQLYNATRWDVAFDDLHRIRAISRACADLPAFQAAHPETSRP